jgi:hypothetical protein
MPPLRNLDYDELAWIPAARAPDFGGRPLGNQSGSQYYLLKKGAICDCRMTESCFLNCRSGFAQIFPQLGGKGLRGNRS